MSKRFIGYVFSFFFLLNLAFIFSQLWKITHIGAATEPAPAAPRYVGFPAADDAGVIGALNLFGRYAQTKGGQRGEEGYRVRPQGITDQIIRDAPESRLAGKITGLLLSGNENKSLVIIERAGKQASYGIGERIIDSNAVILRILHDKILLNENGYYASMILKE